LIFGSLLGVRLLIVCFVHRCSFAIDGLLYGFDLTLFAFALEAGRPAVAQMEVVPGLPLLTLPTGSAFCVHSADKSSHYILDANVDLSWLSSAEAPERVSSQSGALHWVVVSLRRM
jgi:hypothetical protein